MPIFKKVPYKLNSIEKFKEDCKKIKKMRENNPERYFAVGNSKQIPAEEIVVKDYMEYKTAYQDEISVKID